MKGSYTEKFCPSKSFCMHRKFYLQARPSVRVSLLWSSGIASGCAWNLDNRLLIHSNYELSVRSSTHLDSGCARGFSHRGYRSNVPSKHWSQSNVVKIVHQASRKPSSFGNGVLALAFLDIHCTTDRGFGYAVGASYVGTWAQTKTYNKWDIGASQILPLR